MLLVYLCKVEIFQCLFASFYESVDVRCESEDTQRSRVGVCVCGGGQSGCPGTAAYFVYNPVTGPFLAIRRKDMFLKTQKIKFTSRHQRVCVALLELAGSKLQRVKVTVTRQSRASLFTR